MLSISSDTITREIRALSERQSDRMLPISGKVTASTVAASGTTLVCSILAPHVFHGQLSPDLQGLIETIVTAGITFASGYMARHGIVAAVAKDVQAVESAVAPANVNG